MQIDMKTAEAELASRLAGIPDAQDIAWATVWLEACGYGGVKLLAEALADGPRSHDLARDALGIDLENVSCAFLAPAIMRDVHANGRVFLRNVRHGLFMLPFTVRDSISRPWASARGSGILMRKSWPSPRPRVLILMTVPGL
jgi:hypothetical protein